ncbi:MAG: hypothetical protein ABJC26_16385 [Gemmatimonadaceae bacterium]
MPGPIVHLSATVICAHGGQATPTVPFPRVMVSGQPIATIATPYIVAGCPFPPVSGGPCVTAQWVMGATRVMAGGAPVVVQSGVAVCVPTGTPLTVLVVQPRVTAI